jgi:HSP20 family protein
MTHVNCTPRTMKANPEWKNLWGSFANELFRTPGVFNTQPAVNIKETPAGFHLEVAAPGLKKEDFKLQVDNKMLTISAKVETSSEEKEENYSRKEFSYSAFERSFKLPETIAIEGIAAKYENGVLFVELPKREEAKEKPVREIQIG